MQLNFDATKFNPEQGTPKHPTGKFPATVSNISVEENKNKDGGYLQVSFTTPAGMINKNYNLWFQSPNEGQQKAIEIAQKELSALCHATGIFRLGDGRELINARLMIEVTPQVKNDKYNEVSKVYDANGNEPGKAPIAAAGNGNWNAQPASPAASPVQQGGGWAPGQQPVQNNAPAANPAPTGGNWQQGAAQPVANDKPPWAK